MANPVTQPGVECDIVYAVESDIGTPPTGSDPSQKVRKVQSTLNPQVANFQSNEFASHQQVQDMRNGMRSVTGTVDGELSLSTYDDWLEAAFRGTWAVGGTTGSQTLGADNATGSFTRGSGSFITDGFKIGDIVRPAGFAGGGAGNNANNFRITALTALNMTVTPKPATIAEAAGVTIAVPGKKLVMGTVKRSFSIEQVYPAIGASELFKGCRCVGATLSIPPNAMATGSFSFFGLDTENLVDPDSPYFTAASDETTGAVLAGPSGVVRVKGVDTAVATAFQVQLNGSFTNTPVIGSNTAPDIYAGRLVATGSFSAYLESLDYAEALLKETEIDIQMVLNTIDETPNGFLSLMARRVKLTGKQQTLTANGGVIATYAWQALRKVGGAGTVYDTSTLVLQRSNT